jgi:(2Fe-2S) ferredoxin
MCMPMCAHGRGTVLATDCVMGKKRKLRKRLAKRGVLESEVALVVCVGKKCAPKTVSKAVAEHARTYGAAQAPPVRLEIVGCLHVCKKGPIAATFPKIRFHKRVDAERADELVEKLAAKARR